MCPSRRRFPLESSSGTGRSTRWAYGKPSQSPNCNSQTRKSKLDSDLSWCFRPAPRPKERGHVVQVIKHGCNVEHRTKSVKMVVETSITLKTPLCSLKREMAWLRQSWSDSRGLTYSGFGAVSNFSMRMRWRPTLCLWGLVLFGLLTYASIQGNREMRHGRHGRYFWWGSVRLDSDPLDKHPTQEPCTQGQDWSQSWSS
jgi:hypothetical protein